MSNPRKLLTPFVQANMNVLEPGPGMGFFTLELARLVGEGGRVIAVDVQPRMIAGLKRRAAKAGLLRRIDARLAGADSMQLADVAGTIDFTLAFAVVHEFPAAGLFFAETAAASKPGASLLLVEPAGHVKAAEFDAELQCAANAGFAVVSVPSVRRCRTALLQKNS